MEFCVHIFCDQSILRTFGTVKTPPSIFAFDRRGNMVEMYLKASTSLFSAFTNYLTIPCYAVKAQELSLILPKAGTSHSVYLKYVLLLGQCLFAVVLRCTTTVPQSKKSRKFCIASLKSFF